MDKLIKILTVIVLILAVVILILKLKPNASVNQVQLEDQTIENLPKNTNQQKDSVIIIEDQDYWVNDSLYKWDQQQMNWISVGLAGPPQAKLSLLPQPAVSSPIKINWKLLMDIHYRLKYFKTIEADIFSPVFGEDIIALNEKEIIIEGFVIPFDEEGELLALSYNPYSSCFFCGNASPASVISLFMKDKSTIYGLDDFKKFKGKLHLNYDDPNQFYYILKDVIEI